MSQTQIIGTPPGSAIERVIDEFRRLLIAQITGIDHIIITWHEALPCFTLALRWESPQPREHTQVLYLQDVLDVEDAKREVAAIAQALVSACSATDPQPENGSGYAPQHRTENGHL